MRVRERERERESERERDVLRVLSHAKKENRCDTHTRTHGGKHAQIRR